MKSDRERRLMSRAVKNTRNTAMHAEAKSISCSVCSSGFVERKESNGFMMLEVGVTLALHHHVHDGTKEGENRKELTEAKFVGFEVQPWACEDVCRGEHS